MTMKPSLHVCVTGAAGQIAYSLFQYIAGGAIFGKDQTIILSLLDVPPMMDMLKGVIMELEDCAFPLLKEMKITSDPNEAFHQADVIFMLGAMPRREGMLRKDLLHANAAIFKAQGQVIDKVAKKSVKVVVVGNPANTNALIASSFAPSIPAENFSALTRLDQNRAISLSAHKAGVSPSKVKQVIVWGNHSNTQYPDLSHAILRENNFEKPLLEKLGYDMDWVHGDFLKTVQLRGSAVIAARKLSSAMSAAKAIADHMHDWWQGTPEGDFVSMAVPSDGSYDIPKGIVYSFPVTVDASTRTWSIVKSLVIDPSSASMMKETLKELLDEKEEAFNHLSSLD